MDGLTRKQKAIRFFFPFAPHRLFSSVKLMALLGALIALRIILNFISIPIAPIKMSISFSWVPTMLVGWIFGPISGFIMGFVLDTICFLITPNSVWFWMYAIQEPIVGFMGGIAASVCTLRMNREKANPMYDILVQQFMLVAFIGTSVACLFLWIDTGSSALRYFNTYKIVTLVMLGVYVVIMECFTFIQIKGFEKHKERTLMFIYSTMLVTVMIITFSFALGPITAVEYLKYINGVYPSNYLTYGVIIYLVPRVVVESIKTPLEALIMFGLVVATRPVIRSINNTLANKW